MYKNYKNIKFLDCESIEGRESRFKMHKDLYNLCKRHGAVLDLATSDLNIYIQNGSQKLFDRVKQIYPNRLNNDGQVVGGVQWEDEEAKEICIW
jgi:hypothetical protein